MCKNNTAERQRYALAVLLALAILPGSAFGQNPAAQWRHVGGYAVDGARNRLSGTVAGSVDRVWYSGDGATLYITTISGRTYQTADLENWTVTNGLPNTPRSSALGLPPGSASVPGTIQDLAISPKNLDEIAAATDLGVFRSVDAGKSWTSLNDSLPNLPVVRLLNLPENGQGVRVDSQAAVRRNGLPVRSKRGWQRIIPMS